VTLIVIFIALILLHSLVSKRLERTPLTAPIVFAGAGMLALLVLPSLREQQGNREVLMTVFPSPFFSSLWRWPARAGHKRNTPLKCAPHEHWSS